MCARQAGGQACSATARRGGTHARAGGLYLHRERFQDLKRGIQLKKKQLLHPIRVLTSHNNRVN
jgi:hypothetical protein